MCRVNHAVIRRTRVGRIDEKFNETAARIGVHPADVHRATQWEYLEAGEREAIAAEFLRGEKPHDIANGTGVSPSCVLRTVREAFSQAWFPSGQAIDNCLPFAVLVSAPRLTHSVKALRHPGSVG